MMLRWDARIEVEAVAETWQRREGVLVFTTNECVLQHLIRYLIPVGCILDVLYDVRNVHICVQVSWWPCWWGWLWQCSSWVRSVGDSDDDDGGHIEWKTWLFSLMTGWRWCGGSVTVIVIVEEEAWMMIILTDVRKCMYT